MKKEEQAPPTFCQSRNEMTINVWRDQKSEKHNHKICGIF